MKKARTTKALAVRRVEELDARVRELQGELEASRAALRNAQDEARAIQNRMQVMVTNAQRMEKFICSQPGLVVMKTDAGAFVAMTKSDRLARGTTMESCLKALEADAEHPDQDSIEMRPELDGGWSEFGVTRAPGALPPRRVNGH